MIPQVNGKEWTDKPSPAMFLPPYNEKFNNFSQNVLGGKALNNGFYGRMYQQWNISYDINTEMISVKPKDGDIVWQKGEPGIKSLSLAFDNNMNLVIGWKKEDGCYMYYFDTITMKYITRPFLGATACRVCVDDPRDFYNANSDVMFIYTLNNKLYYRRQRDRYDIEYYVGDTKRELQRAGPTVSYRVQIELI